MPVAAAPGRTSWRKFRHRRQAPKARPPLRATAARSVNPDVLVLCHGGPIATPKDAQFILKNAKGCNGFYGASSMERLPAEIALTETTRKFKRIKGRRSS